MKRISFWIPGGLLLAGIAPTPIVLAQSDQAQLARPSGAADLNNHLARLADNPRDVSALIGAGEAALALDDARAAAGFFARADGITSGNGRIKAGLARVMLQMQNPGEALRLFDQAQRLGYPDATILSDRALARDMTGDQAGAQRDYQAALLRTPGDDELVRRYAASLGIAGQVEAAEKILDPLLYKSDRAAWRYKAFILAMNNRQADAKKIADQTMPAQLAIAIVPYMLKMPYLTPAQKAAAVHFGHFPQQTGTTIAAIVPTPPAPGITLSKPPVTVAAAPATTRTKALSRSEQRRQQREADRLARAEAARLARQPRSVQTAQSVPTPQPPPQLAQAQVAAPVPQPMRQPAPPQAQVQSLPPTLPPTLPLPLPSSPPAIQSAPTQPVTNQPAPQVQSLPASPSTTPPPAQTPPVRQAAAPSAQVQGPPAPGFDSIDRPAQPTPPAASPASQINAITLAQASTPPVAAPVVQALPPAPPPTTTPQPNPEATRSLAEIIRAIDVPDTEKQATVAAVDLDEIAALQTQRRAERQAAAKIAAKLAADKAKKDALAKAKAEADAKAKAEAEEKKRLAANPSRNWLQVGVGQSKSALGFTMKGLRKKYAPLAPQSAWSAGWSRTNRLLVGPFPSFARAKEMEDKLKAAGADVFAWKSDAGEVVERLAGD
ncbi:SPOR domain-containing protein [Sphingobium sp. HBC34]|uniref:SPOR domain-containing protein n=1 Tax=Sphingobium cyanobacteriorum TaxID=3063954 RepID=A0ABT8ZJI5_9SPHN|nr:SPOR domain-containing protein [Sphingobium sp. HBC34]MDO7834687.1 SPOR domain-containing protein [Sphingobium sp. HBC34]